MYSIVSGLKLNGVIYILNKSILGLREIRAKNQFKNLPQKQEKYLLWLGIKFKNLRIVWHAIHIKLDRIIVNKMKNLIFD